MALDNKSIAPHVLQLLQIYHVILGYGKSASVNHAGYDLSSGDIFDT
jgi:hypothetical protein